MSVETSPSRLTFAEYRFLFKAAEPIDFPEFTGSLWRGAFGHSLRQLYCCGRERHTDDCIYSRLFEPQMPEVKEDAGILKTVASFPVPYVFRVQRQQIRRVLAGESFSVRLLLVANANHYLRPVINAMQVAGRGGLGKDYSKAELREVVQLPVYGNATAIFANGIFFRSSPLCAPHIPEPATSARIHLLTPVNLGDKGEFFSVERFLMGVVRRVSLLHQFYADAPLEADFAELKRQAAHIGHKAEVWSGGWQRYSSRQQAMQPMRGWLGDIFLQGAGLAAFWPYLHLGQWLHTGKSTNMGLGRYELQRVRQ